MPRRRDRTTSTRRTSPVSRTMAGALLHVAARSSLRTKPRRQHGWGVYKNSLTFNAETAHSKWTKHPKTVCDDNLKKQVSRGMKKSDVLRREWRLKTEALLHFTVAAASKSKIKKRQTGGNSEYGSRWIAYPVIILCEEAL